MTGGTKNTSDLILNSSQGTHKPRTVVESEGADNSPKTTEFIQKKVVRRIDNPGRGNCAFYAFSIGLIDIIKKERAANGNVRSPMFERWIALDPSFANDYEAICAFDLNNPNKQTALLDRMQMGLRKITYQYKLSELRKTCARSRLADGYAGLVGTSSFVNFSYLFYGLKRDNDPRYNEFADEKIKAALVGGRNFHLLDEFPEDPKKLKNSYIFCKDELSYINVNGEVKKVKINNLALFKKELVKINGDSSSSLKLTAEQIKKLITSNGGHTPTAALKRMSIDAAFTSKGINALELKKRVSQSTLPGLLERVLNITEAGQQEVWQTIFDEATWEVKKPVLLQLLATHLPELTELERDELRREISNGLYEAVSDERKKHVLEILQEDNTLFIDGFENYILAPLFLRLLYGDDVDLDATTEETPIAPNSAIPSAIERITQNYFWGTHLDLDYLAYPFEVNLHTLENKIQKYPFNDEPDRPILTVNNEGNGHWTTLVEEIQKVIVRPTNIRKIVKETETIKKAESKVEPEIKVQPENKVEAESKAPLPRKPVARKKLFKEINDVEELQRVIGDAVIRYCAHSDGIIFSFFHRHGKSGRDRAQAFLAEINVEKDFNEVKNLLIDYLENDKKGNTHPHSFRTMLLHELTNPSLNTSLQETSKNYDWQLVQLKKQIDIEENTATTILSSL
ncbi:hypothetical protein [Legionella rowbothamii]|uniref:hypothetical protein n=1 Tax=Legionella rowbothamii TaxID=96229 RepID=UPI001055C74A|nr:hypothetical protein [Legionella rowbothamii]